MSTVRYVTSLLGLVNGKVSYREKTLDDRCWFYYFLSRRGRFGKNRGKNNLVSDQTQVLSSPGKPGSERTTVEETISLRVSRWYIKEERVRSGNQVYVHIVTEDVAPRTSLPTNAVCGRALDGRRPLISENTGTSTLVGLLVFTPNFWFLLYKTFIFSYWSYYFFV